MILLKKPYEPLMYTGISATFNVYGKSFMRLNAVYLSGIPVANTTLHNPFSGVPKLSAYYPEFTAYKLLTSEYFTNLDNTITINIPAPLSAGYIDVIAQNPAGYGILTKYVIRELYSNTQTQNKLRPWSSGIRTLTGAEILPTFMFTINGNMLITISGDNIVFI